MTSKPIENSKVLCTGRKDPLQASDEILLRSDHGDGTIICRMCREICFEPSIGERTDVIWVRDERCRWVGEVLGIQFCVVMIRQSGKSEIEGTYYLGIPHMFQVI